MTPTIKAESTPARAGTLGISYPRLPSDVFPYDFAQAERDISTLAWLSGRELELMTGEDRFGRDRYTVFDSTIGDAITEGPTAYAAVDDAARELLTRNIK